jgi:hypothetical protein
MPAKACGYPTSSAHLLEAVQGAQVKRTRPPASLAALPHVATRYLHWSNRFERVPIVRVASVGLVSAAVVGFWILWVHRLRVDEVLGRLQRHTVMTAVLAGIVAAAFVSHRRSMHAERAPRSWLAALPISSRGRRIEALALQLGPVITATVLISCFCLLTSVMLALAGLSAKSCLVAWRTVLQGTFLGVGGGLIVPHSKPLSPYPGSRYVPHRTTPGRHPVPSLGGLAIWPIRSMFAMLRPKNLSRTLLPVLIVMPLGTTTEMVMTLIESSWIIAAGLEYQRSAPKTAAASRALCSLRVATAASFSPPMPWIAGTCETFVQPPLAFAPTIPTRIL